MLFNEKYRKNTRLSAYIVRLLIRYLQKQNNCVTYKYNYVHILRLWS
jgi:hypothetical protein